MTAIPPGGQEPKEPTGPQPSEPIKPSADSKNSPLLDSPFAKMFARTGHTPTAKEMKGIMDQILQTVINEAKRDEARMKKAMRKLKKRLEGND